MLWVLLLLLLGCGPCLLLFEPPRRRKYKRRIMEKRKIFFKNIRKAKKECIRRIRKPFSSFASYRGNSVSKCVEKSFSFFLALWE
jgi:hypothetical protein